MESYNKLICKLFKTNGEVTSLSISDDWKIAQIVIGLTEETDAKTLKILLKDVDTYPLEKLYVDVFGNPSTVSVKVASGKRYDGGCIASKKVSELYNKKFDVDEDDFYTERLETKLKIRSTESLRSFVLKTLVKDEDIYSYYGNQDGWSACKVFVSCPETAIGRLTSLSSEMPLQLDVQPDQEELVFSVRR